jgi:hypothetical protein
MKNKLSDDPERFNNPLLHYGFYGFLAVLAALILFGGLFSHHH